MYSITIIRVERVKNSLDELCFEFQNTELHSCNSKPSVIEELNRYGVDSEQMQKFSEMNKGDSITIQINSETTNNIWFIYLGKFN